MTDLAAAPSGLVFAWPWMLLALVAVPLVVLWYRRLQRDRAARRARLATLGLVAARAEAAGWRRRLPPVLLLVALAVLVTGLEAPAGSMDVAAREGLHVLRAPVSPAELEDVLAALKHRRTAEPQREAAE